MNKAKEPFTFKTRFHLSELTGLKARNIEELLSRIKEVPGSCIYHHTHRFLQLHEYSSPESPNDFGYWIASALGEDELAEKLSSIDIIEFNSLRAIREKIVAVIEQYIEENPSCKQRSVKFDKEFYFVKSINFVTPTSYVANDLAEFKAGLIKVSTNSIYFHMFDAKLRLEKETNDFSKWAEESLGDVELAREISKLDPYSYALDDLRIAIINIVSKKVPIDA
jgi:septum formation topological specificity factor MinE